MYLGVSVWFLVLVLRRFRHSFCFTFTGFHNHCLLFVPSLWRVAHVEREERRIFTTVVKFAWYLGVCRYCREVWIFILCVVVVCCVGVFGSVCC